MKHILRSAFVAALLWFGTAGVAQAQVWVRAPFVRVGVGPGVYVRAPFVNLYIPTGDRYYYGGTGMYAPGYYGPGVIYGEPRVTMPPADGSTGPPPSFTAPTPKIIESPRAAQEKELPKTPRDAGRPAPREVAAERRASTPSSRRSPRGGSWAELKAVESW
ncbi:MAG: hypothetical protein U0793_05410 [Gemmataceae bacterium]